jgi:hypothetical protein
MFFHGEQIQRRDHSSLLKQTEERERLSLANQRKKKAKERAAQRNMSACDVATQNSFHHLLFPDKFFPGAHLLTRRRAERHIFFSASGANFSKSVSPLLAGVLKARALRTLFPAAHQPATRKTIISLLERSRLSSAARAILSVFFHPQPLLIAKKSTFALCWRRAARRRI